jgi:hypothetical protein
VIWQKGTNCSVETVRNRVEETLAEVDADAGKSCEQVAVRLPLVTINISLIATVPADLFHFSCTVYSSILRPDVVDTSETSVPIYENVRPNFPKEQFLFAFCLRRHLRYPLPVVFCIVWARCPQPMRCQPLH